MHATRRIAVCAVLAAALDSRASGQARPAIPPSEKNFFVGTPAGWVHPKTPWGDPDLQGIYPLNYVGSTPLQRCNGGGRGGAAPPCDPRKEFLTEDEFKTIQANAAKAPDRFAAAAQQGEAGRAFLAGVTDPTTPQRQTSLIFDPPNGRLPEMTEEGKRMSAKMKSTWPLPGENLYWESYKDFDLWDRCITRGMPVSMFPFRYNNGVQIIQGPGQVTILMEMIHDARIVPLDANAPDKTPVPAVVKQWMGVPRGHWEGNTLVVESANFRSGASQTNTAVIASPPGNRFPTSEQMKITEKFTRVNDQSLIYEITTEDPVVLTHSWTARFPLKADPNYKLLEYTCHEDNRVIGDWISVSRADRAKAGANAAPPQR